MKTVHLIAIWTLLVGPVARATNDPFALKSKSDPFAVKVARPDPFVVAVAAGKCGPNRCGKDCKCCPACGGPDEACQCSTCKCCPGCCFAHVIKKRPPKTVKPKSAYYVAYHKAIVGRCNLLTARPKDGWVFPVGELEGLANRQNAVFVLVPESDDRVPFGVRLWRYEDGELVNDDYAPSPAHSSAPVYFAPTMNGGGC